MPANNHQRLAAAAMAAAAATGASAAPLPQLVQRMPSSPTRSSDGGGAGLSSPTSPYLPQSGAAPCMVHPDTHSHEGPTPTKVPLSWNHEEAESSILQRLREALHKGEPQDEHTDQMVASVANFFIIFLRHLKKHFAKDLANLGKFLYVITYQLVTINELHTLGMKIIRWRHGADPPAVSVAYDNGTFYVYLAKFLVPNRNKVLTAFGLGLDLFHGRQLPGVMDKVAQVASEAENEFRSEGGFF